MTIVLENNLLTYIHRANKKQVNSSIIETAIQLKILNSIEINVTCKFGTSEAVIKSFILMTLIRYHEPYYTAIYINQKSLNLNNFMLENVWNQNYISVLLKVYFDSYS